MTPYDELPPAFTIDVALATKNRPTALDSIAALSAQTAAPRMNLYLLDGNAGDALAHAVEDGNWRFRSVHYERDADVLRGRPPRWPIMYNHLLRQGSAPALCYWSDDLELSDTGFFEQGLNALARERCGAVSFAFADGPDATPRVPLLSDHFPLTGVALYIGFLRRAAFEEAGGLCEDYTFWFADVELSHRVQSLGWHVAGVDQCWVRNHRDGKWRNDVQDVAGDFQRFVGRVFGPTAYIVDPSTTP